MSGSPIITATLAELFIKQGHLEKGIEIYRQLLAKEPDNAKYIKRIKELSPEGASGEGIMDFREHLNGIVNSVEGCLLCTLMGFDGIEIDSAKAKELPDDYDLPSVLIEYAGLLSKLKASNMNLMVGGLKEYEICSEKAIALLRPINDEYFIGMTMAPGGNIGKGRYMLRITAPKFVEELS